MKALFRLTLFCLLFAANASAQEVTVQTQNEGELSLPIDLSSSPDQIVEDTQRLEKSLGIPVMRDRQTITESSKDLLITADELDSGYGKMIQEFAATLDQENNTQDRRNEARRQNLLMQILIGLVAEIALILIILQIAFKLCRFRSKLRQLIPLSIAVALVGAFTSGVFDIGLFNPIRIGLSFIILLLLIRTLTNVHEWATAILIALTTRLISIAMMWLVVMGYTVLIEL